MDWTTSLLPLATAFGFALLHTLWMGTLLYALVRTVAPFLPSANAKYFLGYAALWALAAGFGYALYDGYYVAPVCENILLAAPPTVFIPTGNFWATGPEISAWSDRLGTITPFLSIIYLTGLIPVCYLLWVNQLKINVLKRTGLTDIPTEWTQSVRELLHDHPVTRRVTIHLSGVATEVMTLGFWSPVIVLPVALAAQLTPAMARTLLLHEIAHLRHYDHLLNYPQQILWAVFFYHPAVHALSRFIDREREHRCDDWVAEYCPDRRIYASALVAAAQFSITQNPLAMSATKTPFSSRIHRLLSSEQAPENSRFALSALLVVLLGVGHFSYANTDLGADAGAVDCLQEQGDLVFTPNAEPDQLLSPITIQTLTPSPQTAPGNDHTPPAPSPKNLAPATRQLVPHLVGATAPLIHDTIPPGNLKIKSDNRSARDIPTVGSDAQATRAPGKEKRNVFVINDGVGDYEVTEKSVIRLDGKIVDGARFDDLELTNVRKISVVNDAEKLAEMGFAGHDGLVEITTNQATGVAKDAQPVQWPTGLAPVPKVKMTGKIAYFIEDVLVHSIPSDGNPNNDDPINELNPEHIEAISVIKGAEPLSKLDLSDYEGAIFVTLKKRYARKFLKEKHRER
ncbi:M56 family metallopeptidase [Neolewinella antarctica]|uniref:Beta-lactamase regulating signal transducer with metallopeptidase domain n=1 Tax=Neolewinella antarctica TaxID=442734 RepID=A0ABX0XBZ6_9BACT|nr:M56 family metallopeptidase [Neolewinella antarctica]NJC26479.1 beta-lactamase regulating signal transducer with metallopeptidase domain [Neolewinella antarctica]